MLTLLIAALQARFAHWQERRALRRILDKDDRTLADIGLSRADVHSVLSKTDLANPREEAFRLSRLAHRPFNMF